VCDGSELLSDDFQRIRRIINHISIIINFHLPATRAIIDNPSGQEARDVHKGVLEELQDAGTTVTADKIPLYDKISPSESEDFSYEN
jgi:hypothetical protein